MALLKIDLLALSFLRALLLGGLLLEEFLEIFISEDLLHILFLDERLLDEHLEEYLKVSHGWVLRSLGGFIVKNFLCS